MGTEVCRVEMVNNGQPTLMWWAVRLAQKQLFVRRLPMGWRKKFKAKLSVPKPTDPPHLSAAGIVPHATPLVVGQPAHSIQHAAARGSRRPHCPPRGRCGFATDQAPRPHPLDRLPSGRPIHGPERPSHGRGGCQDRTSCRQSRVGRRASLTGSVLYQLNSTPAFQPCAQNVSERKGSAGRSGPCGGFAVNARFPTRSIWSPARSGLLQPRKV